MKRKKCIFTVGIPGSGKSTWSLDFISKNPNWIRFSRDDFRFMLKNSPFLDNKGEKLISDIILQNIKQSLNNGYNVIVDNTNCKLSYINNFIKELNHVCDIEFKVFDVDIDICIERDSKRSAKVGESIIRKMNADFIQLSKEFDFSPIPFTPKIFKDYSIDWNENLPDAIICDIDGTICHYNDKRIPYEWKKVGLDAPDKSMINILNRLTSTRLSDKLLLIMVSGRDEICRNETEKYLNDHYIKYDYLFMRPIDDNRKDFIVKKEIYENKIRDNFNIIMIFDDRTQVVNMWRKLGLKCAQVESGDF